MIHLIWQRTGYTFRTAVLLVGLCLSGPLFAQQGLVAGASIPHAIPFQLPDLDDTIHRLSDYRGKVLVVNFWATWCPPCQREIPSMNRAWTQLKGEGVEMLAINVGEDNAAISAFLKESPIDFPVVLDDRGIVSQRWMVFGMPTTFIVDSRGFIAHRIAGYREWDSPELLQMIRKLKPVGRVKKPLNS